MIMRDLVLNLVLKLDVFMTKKGQDMMLTKEVVSSINAITGDDSLDTIYINNNDNIKVPDVYVMPLFNKDFSKFLMNPDLMDINPYGYSVEINARCFTKYTCEELAAVIIHHILQNVQSSTAKARFLSAYTAELNKHKNSDILEIFDTISHSEVVYMAYLDICMRPFCVPVCGYNYIGTDEVLVSMGIGDAYDSALGKSLPMSNTTPEETMEREIDQDYKTMHNILQACMNNDVHNYYKLVKDNAPIITIQNVLNLASNGDSLGFVSHDKNYKKTVELNQAGDRASTLSESILKPQNEIEVRFQMDKILTDIRYAANEDERAAILYRIKELSLKLTRTADDIQNKLGRVPTDKNLQYKLNYLGNFISELEMMRDRVVKMEIQPKKYGLFVSYPSGYDY